MAKPPPAERTKGGWLRKRRRITPTTVADYWPTRARRDLLRLLWPTYIPTAEIVRRINRKPAPKQVTVWQCCLLASRLKVRRPLDLRSKTNAVEAIVGKGNGIPRLAKLPPPPDVELRAAKRPDIKTYAEPESLVQKRGRKKAKKRPKAPRLWSVGLGSGRRKPLRKKAAKKKASPRKRGRTQTRKRSSVLVAPAATL